MTAIGANLDPAQRRLIESMSRVSPTASPESGDPMNATARTIRKTAKAAVAEAVVAAAADAVAKTTRKPRAKATVTKATDAVSLERLAVQAVTVAEKARAAMEKLTDPKRRVLAAIKAQAAMETANERATDAGTSVPFNDDAMHDVHDEIHGSRNDSPDDVGPQPEDDPSSFAMPRMTKSGRVLMDMIGRRQFTWFDEGIAANSGIWHSCLTDEATGAPGLPEKALGVAQVIRALGKAGLLYVDEQGEDGVWVALTAEGAQVANALASEPEPTDPPVPAPTTKVAPTAKAKTTPVTTPKAKTAAPAKVPAAKVAKTAKTAKVAPAPVDAVDHPKVISLRDYGVAQGWSMTVAATGVGMVVVTAKRAEPSESLTTTFIDGKLDLAVMPIYVRADGSKVLLRNVSAVKKQMDSDPSARPVKAQRSVAKVARKRGEDAAAPAIRSLPFDPATATDAEIAKAVAGATVTWKMSDGTVVEAVVGKKVAVKIHPRKPGAANRVVSFWEQVVSEKHGLVAGPERHVGLDRMLTVA